MLLGEASIALTALHAKHDVSCLKAFDEFDGTSLGRESPREVLENMF